VRNRHKNISPNIPGPVGWPVIGSLPAFQQNLIHFWERIAKEYGGIAGYRIGAERHYLVSDPEFVAHIFQYDTQRYFKGKYQQLLKSALGEGLLISNDSQWRKSRQALQPLFRKDDVTRWFDIIIATTENLLDQWHREKRQNQSVDIAADMISLTQQIIAKMLFGRHLSYGTNQAMREAATTTINNHLLQQVMRKMLFGRLVDYLPFPGTHRYRKMVTLFHNTLSAFIEKASNGDDHDAVITHLIKTQQSKGVAYLSNQQLHDELTTLFFAGHETTACALAWTFYYLTEYPDAANQVCEEVSHVITGQQPTYQEVMSLTYLRQVIEESMRLMPPVYGLGRRARTDDTVGDWHLSAGSAVAISPYVMHRHPAYWDAPEAFDPNRFSANQRQQRPRYAYCPFGGGARSCIGMHLAMMEIITIVAMIIRRFHLRRPPQRHVSTQLFITLRPREGVIVQVTPR